MQSPISMIPEDVLVSIFELATKQSSGMALTLAHVSPLWRTIAHAYATLWTTITVSNTFYTCLRGSHHPATSEYALGPRPHDIHQPDLLNLRHYLYYSKDRLLDVRVDAEMPHLLARRDEELAMNNVRYHGRTTRIALLLARHTKRIRSLSVQCDSYYTFIHFFDTIKSITAHEEWGSLEHLDVQWHGPIDRFTSMDPCLRNRLPFGMLEDRLMATSADRPEYPLPGPTSGFEHLRFLTLGGTNIDWDTFAPTNLQELHLLEMNDDIKPTYEQLRWVLLRNAATLIKLSLVDVFTSFDGGNGVDSDTFILPCVHTLKLGYALPEDLDSLIFSLVLPAMRSLMVINTGEKLYETSFKGEMTHHARDHYEATQYLLGSLARAWDLTNIECVKLVDVRCIFQNSTLPEEPSNWNLSHAQEIFDRGYHLARPRVQKDRDAFLVWGPMKFWHACTRLRTVSLVRPDAATLYSLCCPVPEEPPYAPKSRGVERHTKIGSFSDDRSWIHSPEGPSLRLPCPRLRTIKLKVSQVDDSVVNGFIDRRNFFVGCTKRGVKAEYIISE
ncbi:hypothetical protein BDN72DRAFT_862058 [Pluteus cervinus]|uniref:Uncharacterized protein n=1 Tax=Pluteus cervinus TaxID=181527 RepID=A0ACD3ACQ4_9AGAR|nr:hypothetical protein BDN72DRAFT_862058 [Pluteus cervinus]